MIFDLVTGLLIALCAYLGWFALAGWSAFLFKVLCILMILLFMLRMVGRIFDFDLTDFL